MPSGLVVEQRFVHRAELLDAEIAVGDALASGAIGRRPGREGEHGAPGRLVVQVAAFGERRPRRREQTAVERRHPQIPGAAAGVREAGDRSQRVPQPRRRLRTLGRGAQRLDAVALAVHRMPQRDEAAGFREQQEEDAIHDRQRLLERVVEWLTVMAPAPRRPKERAEHVGRCGKDAVAQRSGDCRRMKVGRLDDRVQRRAIAAGRGRKRRRVQERPERGARALVVDREIDVELEESPRIQPAGVDEPKVGAVEDQRPRGGPPDRLGHRDAPMRIEAVAPRRHQQNNRMSAGADGRNQDRVQPLDRRRSFECQRSLVDHDARAWFAVGWVAARREVVLVDCAHTLRQFARAKTFWGKGSL